MKVIVSGCDFAPRPHIRSWLPRAFRALGCEVVVATADWGDTPSHGHSYTDPAFEVAQIKMGSTGAALSDVVRAVGGADLCVHVDQGDNWAVYNDGAIPYAYVWRECNPGEDHRARIACGDGPMFCCMTGPNKINPPGSIPFPFAADRALFCDPPLVPFEEREHVFVYSGRERGNGTNARLGAALGGTCLFPGYMQGYEHYARALSKSKSTVVLDASTYVGSRGVEAAAAGCAVFWDRDDGAAAWMGFEWGVNALKTTRDKCQATGEWMPVSSFPREVLDVCNDKERWTKISKASRAHMLANHTYEERVKLICKTLGLTLP